MQPNVGGVDRILRIVLGLALIASFFVVAAPWKYVALVAGVMALATGLLRFCGLYRLLGINTCKTG